MLVKDVLPVLSQNNKASSQTQTGMQHSRHGWRSAWWGPNANFQLDLAIAGMPL